jgi:transposase
MGCMDRGSLEQLLDRGLSLAEIGRRVGRHESTVAYWVEQHGLRAANREKHIARGGLSRETLELLVEEGASIAEIAAALDRGKATVRYWLGKYGLRTQCPRRGPRRPDIQAARDEGLDRAILCCTHHGNTEHVADKRGSFRCRRCRAETVVRRRRKVKQILVAESGGRCHLCGYDRHVAALEFHHLDPNEKEFGLARRGAHSIDKLREEIGKCVLLCSNCHAEVEAGFVELS